MSVSSDPTSSLDNLESWMPFNSSLCPYVIHLTLSLMILQQIFYSTNCFLLYQVLTKKFFFFLKQAILDQPKDGPDRLEAMRKYGCIYGRYDSKRKNDRPMSLHEVRAYL